MNTGAATDQDGDAGSASTADSSQRRFSVTVGVVTYECAELITDLITSLPAALEGLDWRLVVADNDSKDGTREVVRRLAPDATVINLGGNLGYAAGVNACSRAGGASDALLVLSQSTRLHPGSIVKLAEKLTDDTVGIAVPRLHDGNGRLLRSLRRTPTVLRTLATAVATERVTSKFPRLSETIGDTASYDTETQAAWATGGAMLISSRCLEQVGAWDESFFLYSEEVDFCLRAGDHGFRLVLVPQAEAAHLGGPSRRVPELWALTVTNQVRLFAKRRGPVAAFFFWLSCCAGESVRALASRRPIHRAALRKLVTQFPALLRRQA